MVVTTAVDEDNGTISPSSGAGTSLREAWNYVNGLTGAQTIYFSANLAGQTIRLTTASATNNGLIALRVSPGHNITLQGTTGSMGVTIAANGTMRIIEVGYDINSGTASTCWKTWVR